MLLKPMFAALIDHGWATYPMIRDDLSLWECVRLEDSLAAKVENERRAHQAARDEARGGGPRSGTVELRKPRPRYR